MKSKRLVHAAWSNAASACLSVSCLLAVGLLSPAAARGDDVTAVSNQDQANRLSIFHDYSISAIGNTAGTIPGPPGSGFLSPFLGNAATTEPADTNRSWAVSGTPLFGYDSNPEARKDAAGGLFVGADVNAVYALDLDPDDPGLGGTTHFLFSYDATGALYDGAVKQADVFQQTATGSVRHGFFDDTLILSALLQDQFTIAHGTAFLNTVDVVPSIEQFWCSQFSTQITYDYTRFNYFFHVDKKSHDPDADRHTVMGYLHFYTAPQRAGSQTREARDQLSEMLRHLLSRATFGVGHVWNDAPGADYMYEANRLVFGLDGIRPLKTRALSLDLEYAREWDHFSNHSTFGEPILSKASAPPRRDQLNVLTVRANARLADLSYQAGSLGAFLQWDWINDNSNVPVRHFNEFLVSTGVTYRY